MYHTDLILSLTFSPRWLFHTFSPLLKTSNISFFIFNVDELPRTEYWSNQKRAFTSTWHCIYLPIYPLVSIPYTYSAYPSVTIELSKLLKPAFLPVPWECHSLTYSRVITPVILPCSVSLIFFFFPHDHSFTLALKHNVVSPKWKILLWPSCPNSRLFFREAVCSHCLIPLLSSC